MVYRFVKSKKAGYLFVFAAILEGIQAIVAANIHDTSWIAPIIRLFAALFLMAAGMAFLGVGFEGVTQRSIGGGWYRQSVEYADACICGFTLGLAAFIIAIMELPFPPGFPGGLAGIVAIIAGAFALRNAMKQGVYDEPRIPTPAPPPLD